MKSLVVYDSNYGNTKKIAETIATGIGAEAISVGDATPAALLGLDLLIVGSPIIGWKPTERMATLLSGLNPGQLSGTRVTAFDTRVRLFIHGDAATKILKTLEGFGAHVLTPSLGFHVKGNEGPLYEGELEKAADWAEMIKRGL